MYFHPMIQDMTARDLLQQRITLANGDTSWRYSPLVMAALEGSIAELDGLHRVNPGTLAVFQRYLGRGIPYKGCRSACTAV